MVKIVSIFLIAMVVLALFGRARLSGLGKALLSRPCPRCGRRVARQGGCKCDRGAA
jgi:hypothetical protein